MSNYYEPQLPEQFIDNRIFSSDNDESRLVESDGISLVSSGDETGGYLDAHALNLHGGHPHGLVNPGVAGDLDPGIGTQQSMGWSPVSPVDEASAYYAPLVPGIPQHPSDPRMNVGLSSSLTGLERDATVASSSHPLSDVETWATNGYGDWDGGTIYTLAREYQSSEFPAVPSRKSSRLSPPGSGKIANMDNRPPFPAAIDRIGTMGTDSASRMDSAGSGCGLVLEPALISQAALRARHAPLPRPSKDSWTKEQEDFLVGSKRNRNTFPEISAAMLTRFGVERNKNVLSKKYRSIMDHSSEDSLIQRALANALPSMITCLEEEMVRLGSLGMDEENLQDIRDELKRKLPRFVQRLAMDKH